MHHHSGSGTSNSSLVLTMPALYWSHDDADTESDDNIKPEGDSSSGSSSGAEADSEEEQHWSPALEQSGFFSKSFDPYYKSPSMEATRPPFASGPWKIPSGIAYEDKVIGMAPVMPIVRTLSSGGSISSPGNWSLEEVLAGYAI